MKKLQQGRSMIEMLGVLAIIGVLSIGGLAGYTMAMERHKANQILDYVSRCAVLAQTSGESGKFTGQCNTTTTGEGESAVTTNGLVVGETAPTYATSYDLATTAGASTFTITVDGMSTGVAKAVVARNSPAVKIEKSGTTGAVFTFNK